MKISENQLDSLTHCLSANLKCYGVDLDSDLMCDLNDHLTVFFDKCNIDIESDKPDETNEKLFSVFSGDTLPSIDGAYFQWLEPTDTPDGIRFSYIQGEEIDLSDLIFTTETEAIKAIQDRVWGWSAEDAKDFVLVRVEKTEVHNPFSNDAHAQVKRFKPSGINAVKPVVEIQHSAIRFSLYSQLAFEFVSSDTLIKDSDCVARVEQSGSEGFYVEVAKWNEDYQQWMRHAFKKFFQQEAAKLWAARINATNEMVQIFHTLPEKPLGIPVTIPHTG